MPDYPASDHELTDDEITAHYGDLISRAAVAFATDPQYIVDIARAGTERSHPSVVRLMELAQQPITCTECARVLNREGLISLSGRPWTWSSVSETYRRNAGVIWSERPIPPIGQEPQPTDGQEPDVTTPLDEFLRSDCGIGSLQFSRVNP